VARLTAWLGGAVFLAALAYTVYFYAFVLANALPAAPVALARAVGVNTILFGVFAAHHSIFAPAAAKRWVTRVIRSDMERSVYVWLSSGLLIAVCVLWQLVPGTVYHVDGSARWLFYALQLFGLYITAQGAGLLDPLELAGIRQPQRKPEGVVFRDTGPFRLVRHPIYLGWVLMTGAAPTMTINRLMFALITSLYLVAAIPWEERSLIAAFGQRYRRYQSAVRWRLIPGIW
jgi:methanethiol S-methyltransferase